MIRARASDKTLAVRQAGTKLWFLEVWKLNACQDVWRIEFRLRRSFLKQYRIEPLDDLHKAAGAIWQYSPRNGYRCV